MHKNKRKPEEFWSFVLSAAAWQREVKARQQTHQKQARAESKTPQKDAAHQPLFLNSRGLHAGGRVRAAQGQKQTKHKQRSAAGSTLAGRPDAETPPLSAAAIWHANEPRDASRAALAYCNGKTAVAPRERSKNTERTLKSGRQLA